MNYKIENTKIKLLKESDRLEWKKSTSQLDNSLKTICGFLNHKGGIIKFGIDNRGNMIGQDISDNTIKNITQKVTHKIKPEFIPKIKKVKENKKTILVIKIPEGNNKPYFLGGIPYIRIGTETRLLPIDNLKDLIIEQNQKEWESEICEKATLKDINTKTIKQFIELTKESKRLPLSKKTSTETILKKLNLIKDNKLTNAAIVLFGKNIQKFFTTMTLRCGRFKDEIKESFIDLKDYDGNLFENLESGIAFCQNHIRLKAVIKGLYRVETWEIPTESLREAIINAFIHRDYLTPSFVYIKIYDNSLVISNPGGLSKKLKVSELYKEHKSILRNKLIAKVFYYTGLIDTWGRGTLNIIKYLKKQNLQKPEFYVNNYDFDIIFKREYIADSVDKSGQIGGQISGQLLTKRQKEIIKYIIEKPNISRKKLSFKLNINQSAIQKHIIKFKKNNILKRIGPDKSGYWKKNEDKL